MHIKNDKAVEEYEKENSEVFPLSQFLTPKSDCIICSTTNLSYHINKAYLDGLTYQEICDKHGKAIEEKTQRKLTPSVLSEHFNRHFNARGAAIAEYNRIRVKEESKNLPVIADDVSLFQKMKDKELDDLEQLDSALDELARLNQEIEQIKQEKKKAGRTFGLEDLVMKQAGIVNNLANQLNTKMKTLKQADVQEAKIKHLSMLDLVMVKLLGGGFSKDYIAKNPSIVPKAQKIYLQITIQHIVGLLVKVLKEHMAPELMSNVLTEIKNQTEGLENVINTEFENVMEGFINREEIEGPDDNTGVITRVEPEGENE